MPSLYVQMLLKDSHYILSTFLADTLDCLNILFNFSIPVVREDEDLARIGGISLANSTLGNVDLPLEKLSTHDRWQV